MSKEREQRNRKPGRRWLLLFAAIFTVYLLGPRGESVRSVKAGAPADLPDAPRELVNYLADSERGVDGLVEETRKTIFWFDEEDGKVKKDTLGQRRPVSVVFLHGFSGSHMTMYPLPQIVSERLKANLYCNRYRGHGQKNADGYGEAMGVATLQHWVEDSREALELARKLGDKVIVIANSTAAPIAAWLASEGHAPDALILLSPNFGPKDPLSEILLRPWGAQIVSLLKGGRYHYKKKNIHGDDHRRWATTEYPARALQSMMKAVELGRNTEFENITAPSLCLYSEQDDVVSPGATKKHFSEFSNQSNRLQEVTTTTHNEHHVLAGNVMSSESTLDVVYMIVDFMETAFPEMEIAPEQPDYPEITRNGGP